MTSEERARDFIAAEGDTLFSRSEKVAIIAKLLDDHTEEQREKCAERVYRLTGDAEARDACLNATGQ